MTFLAGFIFGIIATYAVSILAACIYAVVLYGRRVEAERADVATPYDAPPSHGDRYLEGYRGGYAVAWSEAKRSSKPQNTRIV